jgi:hypothetical protein
MKPDTFNSGIPTAPDVKRLVDKFGVPAIGVLLPYEDISETIGSAKGTSRYGSVVSAWRTQLRRENNILLRAEPGKGYVPMDNSERVHYCAARYKGGLRHIGRAAHNALMTATNGLTDEEQRTRNNVCMAGAALKLAAATAAKQLREGELKK